MAGLTRGERLQIMLSDDEYKALDDWRFAQRMPSRASAVRELLRRGLAADGYAIIGKRSMSSDYGVLDTSSRNGAVPSTSGKKSA
jgi:hypothetical protein